MMLSARVESIILSAPLAESMMLSARGHARALTLTALLRAGGAENIILSAGGAESMMFLARVEHTPEKLNCELIVKPEEVQLIDWEFDV